jgi:hypothetical protein
VLGILGIDKDLEWPDTPGVIKDIVERDVDGVAVIFPSWSRN